MTRTMPTPKLPVSNMDPGVFAPDPYLGWEELKIPDAGEGPPMDLPYTPDPAMMGSPSVTATLGEPRPYGGGIDRSPELQARRLAMIRESQRRATGDATGPASTTSGHPIVNFMRERTPIATLGEPQPYGEPPGPMDRTMPPANPPGHMSTSGHPIENYGSAWGGPMPGAIDAGDPGLADAPRMEATGASGMPAPPPVEPPTAGPMSRTMSPLPPLRKMDRGVVPYPLESPTMFREPIPLRNKGLLPGMPGWRERLQELLMGNRQYY